MDDSDAGEFLETICQKTPPDLESIPGIGGVAANNAINMATGYSPFYLNFGDHPLVPSVLMHGGGVSSKCEAVQTMVDRMKTALEEA